MTLAQFTAENGTDGTALSAANVPLQTAPVFNGSVMRFDSAAALNGNLGYYYQANSGLQQSSRFPLTSNLVQSIRFSFNFPTAPAILRSCWGGRSAAAYAGRFRAAPSSGNIQLSMIDASNANAFNFTEVFIPNTWYDCSAVIQANAAGGVADYSVGFYAANTTTLMTSLYTSTTYNVGTVALVAWEFGFNDTGAGAAEMMIDNVQFNDGSTTVISPFFTASARSSTRTYTATGWR